MNYVLQDMRRQILTTNVWVEQDGNEFDFEICNDGGYVSRMAGSYDNMVWSGSLWGGGGMSWPLIG